jgi:hypothetical protein
MLHFCIEINILFTGLLFHINSALIDSLSPSKHIWSLTLFSDSLHIFEDKKKCYHKENWSETFFQFSWSLTGVVLCLAFWHTLNSFSLLFLYRKNGNIKCPVCVIQVFLNFEQHMLYTHIWKIFHFTVNTACVCFIGTTGRRWRENTVEVEQWWTRYRLRAFISREIWQVRAKLKWK